MNLFRLMKRVYSTQNWQVQNVNMPILFIAGNDDPCIVNEKKLKFRINL